MRQWLAWWFVFVVVSPLVAAEPQGKLILDTWDAAYLDGAKAGYVHTTVRVMEQDEGKVYRTQQELNLTVKRFKQTVGLRMATGTDEEEDGRVLAVSMTQVLGQQQKTVMSGAVEGKRLHVVVDEVRGTQTERKLDSTIPWNDSVIGMYRQQRLFARRKVKPGDQFSYQSYEPTIKYVVTAQVTVKDSEEVALPGGKKQRLLRVEVEPEKLTVQTVTVQLPAMTVWLDKQYETVRSETEVPGLGKLTLYRSTKAQTLSQSSPVAEIKDIGISQLVRLNRRLPDGYDTTAAVYRIRLKGDKDPAAPFARDNRQSAENVTGDTFDLHVRAAREPRPAKGTGKVAAEFTESCYFINSDDAKVQELAAEAVGEEQDPWQKALRIERWVHRNMRDVNFTVAFATADQVARTLEGDCTEHAVLAAAMCRAAGVPSRTAFGLIYVLQKGQPAMGFHMWTEVWVRGQWVPIDATLGRGFVGATHVKISDHSWHNMHVLTPLLPVMRVVGKVTIEVVSASNAR